MTVIPAKAGIQKPTFPYPPLPLGEGWGEGNQATMTTTTTKTPLHQATLDSGAQFGAESGWELPASFGDTEAELTALTQGTGLLDVSHVGRIKATGPDVLDLLNRISTNEVEILDSGKGSHTVLTTDKGRILDLIWVYNSGDGFLVLTSPQTSPRVIEWIDKYTIIEDIELDDVTHSTGMASLIGPHLPDFLAKAFPDSAIEADSIAGVVLGNASVQVVRRTLGQLPRADVIFKDEDAAEVWSSLLSLGAVPAGQAAYHAARVQAGAPEGGVDMSESYNPLETGLWGSISFTKGCYIGQEVIARLDTYQKVQKNFVSLRFQPGADVDLGSKLMADGRQVGLVTSLVHLSDRSGAVGLGYVRPELAEPGTTVSLEGDDDAHAEVTAKLEPLGPHRGYR